MLGIMVKSPRRKGPAPETQVRFASSVSTVYQIASFFTPHFGFLIALLLLEFVMPWPSMNLFSSLVQPAPLHFSCCSCRSNFGVCIFQQSSVEMQML